ncbi:novel plant SNARE 11-like [Quercus lobata]|uniref:novel plant SNARE 11-like n=2 Tax=Quercus lobata TaxID=97700 RepID=UPI001247268D|nr:novel plant SNARE 11-like [Quercus lobata]
MGGEVAGSNIDGYVSNLENKRIDLFDRGTKGCGEDNVLLAPYEVTVDGCYLLVQTVQDTINVGTETAAALKDQMELALMAATMTNQQLVGSGNWMMDETDQAIERKIISVSRCLLWTVQDTVNFGTETAAALKAQVVNELDSIHFSIKKASQLVKELGRQVATDKCIMALLFLIVVGVIAIIIVKLVNPNNKDIRDIPGLAPPAMTRKLLWSAS